MSDIRKVQVNGQLYNIGGGGSADITGGRDIEIGYDEDDRLVLSTIYHGEHDHAEDVFIAEDLEDSPIRISAESPHVFNKQFEDGEIPEETIFWTEFMFGATNEDGTEHGGWGFGLQYDDTVEGVISYMPMTDRLDNFFIDTTTNTISVIFSDSFYDKLMNEFPELVYVENYRWAHVIDDYTPIDAEFIPIDHDTIDIEDGHLVARGGDANIRGKQDIEVWREDDRTMIQSVYGGGRIAHFYLDHAYEGTELETEMEFEFNGETIDEDDLFDLDYQLHWRDADSNHHRADIYYDDELEAWHVDNSEEQSALIQSIEVQPDKILVVFTAMAEGVEMEYIDFTHTDLQMIDDAFIPVRGQGFIRQDGRIRLDIDWLEEFVRNIIGG